MLSKLILSYGSFSNKKLQKLCYYIYCWYLVLYGERIADVYFEAWVHGPVSPQIYKEYKKYGWHNIPRYCGSLDISEGVVSNVTRIIDKYIDKDADELEKMTHKEDPWKNARRGYSSYESCNEIIKDKDIINFYKNLDVN